jgi:hypothetical protein
MAPKGRVKMIKDELGGEPIEIVGGTLKGFWMTLQDGNLIILSIEESEDLKEARLEVARHEAASQQNRIIFDERQPVSGLIGQAFLSFIFKRQHKNALEELERLENDDTEISIVAAYPIKETISALTEADETFIRATEAEDYETKLFADKEASFIRSTGRHSIETSVRDRLIDDMRELPEETERCLIVQFVDGNSAIVADFDDSTKDTLSAANLALEDDDLEIVELILDHTDEALPALKAELEAERSRSGPSSDSALERLRWEKKSSAKLSRLTSLVGLCEMVSSGMLSKKHSRYPSKKLTSLSLDLSGFEEIN